MNPPKRVQRKRTTGWRMPENTVYVGRPTKWGNPISALDVAGQYPSLSSAAVARMITIDFEVLARQGSLGFPNWRFAGGERGPVRWTYPPLSEIRTELAGKDLACWCPLDEACHADALLDLASGAELAS